VTARTLLGVSVLWVPLAFLTDATTVLLLPVALAKSSPDRLATMLGVTSLVGLAAAALLQPFAGALSDRVRPRFGRRGYIAVAAGGVLAALAFLATAQAVIAIVVAYIAVQVTASALQAGQQGLLPDIVPAASRGRASGLKGLFDVGGAFVAFGVLGALVANGALDAAVLVAGLSVVVGVVLVVLLVRERRHPVVDDTRDTRDMRDATATRRVRDSLLRVVASRFLFLLGVYLVGRYLVLLVASRLALDVAAAAGIAGALLAVLTAATAAISIPAGWAADRMGRVTVMMAGGVLAAVGIAGLAFASDAQSLTLFGLFMAAGSGAFGAANWAMTADIASGRDAARLFGIANIGTAGAAALAGLGGLVIDATPGFGFSVVLAVAVVAVVCSLFVVRGLPEIVARSLRGEREAVSA
jgi:MFS family permease